MEAGCATRWRKLDCRHDRKMVVFARENNRSSFGIFDVPTDSGEGLLMGEERKWPADGQSDAIDITRTLDGI